MEEKQLTLEEERQKVVEAYHGERRQGSLNESHQTRTESKKRCQQVEMATLESLEKSHLLAIHAASFGAASSMFFQLSSCARKTTGTVQIDSRAKRTSTTKSCRTKTELAERLRLNHWISRGSGAVSKKKCQNGFHGQEEEKVIYQVPS